MTLSRRQVRMRKETKPKEFADTEEALRYLHYIHYKQRRRIVRRNRRLRRQAERKKHEAGVKNEG